MPVVGELTVWCQRGQGGLWLMETQLSYKGFTASGQRVGTWIRQTTIRGIVEEKKNLLINMALYVLIEGRLADLKATCVRAGESDSMTCRIIGWSSLNFSSWIVLGQNYSKQYWNVIWNWKQINKTELQRETLVLNHLLFWYNRKRQTWQDKKMLNLLRLKTD